jgi:hypothetical protein
MFDGFDFQYWKAKMQAYIQAQGYLIWEKVTNPFVVPNQVNDNNRPDVENNRKARNLIIQGLGRSNFDRVVHLKSAYGKHYVIIIWGHLLLKRYVRYV